MASCPMASLDSASLVRTVRGVLGACTHHAKSKVSSLASTIRVIGFSRHRMFRENTKDPADAYNPIVQLCREVGSNQDVRS